MPLTGIKKYDDLPGRIGFKDIDALRVQFSRKQAGLIEAKKDFEEIKTKLNEIVEKNKPDKK